ncbi:hypothetical protein HMF8227_02378 [Saliniradius amylolyticus]|uniref:Solute-binding protein family 3/N-terminal domain-containing protein n=1 Tax=Saliniradius amylolyticus TaxID=2183582 RepID=A0A2S2E6F2_9ALTE|nr:transporter substrate-binding domain-containing protein [Saliniradius amylolyticus]AWL12830.1 hypothetical protein HMF8227_02378 [Saliniradius amylolyticus]
MIRWLWVVVLWFGANTAAADRYVVGTESINFYPHFNFTQQGKPGFAQAVFKRFAQYSGHQFEFVPLPVKRLYYESEGDIDLVYPDHPEWVQYQDVAHKRFFSQPVVGNLGTTWVQPSNRHKTLSQVRSLAIIHGFTPEAWMHHQGREELRFIDVPDPESAIGVLLLGRVEAADLEYNVARHILRKQGRTGDAQVAVHLPLNIGTYHLSTTKHPALIEQFDQFLHNHRQELKALKKRFGIVEKPSGIIPPLR